MLRISSSLWFWVVMLGLPFQVPAGDWDGSHMLLCQVVEGKEYHAGGEMKAFNPESVGLAENFIIDFKNGVVKPTRDSMVQRRSAIKAVEHIENKLILLGAEDGVEGVNDGVGWALVISKDNGRFAVSAAGDNVGYTVFGGCVPE